MTKKNTKSFVFINKKVFILGFSVYMKFLKALRCSEAPQEGQHKGAKHHPTFQVKVVEMGGFTKSMSGNLIISMKPRNIALMHPSYFFIHTKLHQYKYSKLITLLLHRLI